MLNAVEARPDRHPDASAAVGSDARRRDGAEHTVAVRFDAGPRRGHPSRFETMTMTVATGASVAVIASAFAPWGRSGEAVRSSFELIAAADRIDLLEPPWSILAVTWYVLPMLAGAACVAAATARTLVVAVLASTIGALSMTGCAVLYQSPLGPEVGAPLAGVAGGLAVVSGLLLGAMTGRRKADGR